MFIKKKKKNLILTTHLYSNVRFSSIFVTYLNSNTSKCLLKKKKITSSNKNPLPHIKTTHYYHKIFMFFLYIIIIIILILENIPKFWLSKFYTVIMNLHPSTLMYIIFLLFKSQIFLLITILIPINKFKCLIGFQLLTHCYINSL